MIIVMLFTLMILMSVMIIMTGIDVKSHTSNYSISLVYTGSDPLQLFNIKKVTANSYDDRSSTALQIWSHQFCWINTQVSNLGGVREQQASVWARCDHKTHGCNHSRHCARTVPPELPTNLHGGFRTFGWTIMCLPLDLWRHNIHRSIRSIYLQRQSDMETTSKP